MAVRKRTWKTAGSTSEAWVVDYRAHDPLTGKVSRHWETYEKKRDADAREAQIKKDTRKGTHIALSASVSIRDAAETFLDRCENGCKQQAGAHHADELQGGIRFRSADRRPLVHFTAQLVRNLEDSLHKKTSPITRKPFSHVMVARCLRTLGAVFADAQERGVVTSNPCREIARKRLTAEEKRSGRDKGRLLEIGKDIPSLDETRWIIEAADPAWKVLLMTAAFTGMRSSELRVAVGQCRFLGR